MLIGLDLGTSAIKGVRIDVSGHILAEAGAAVQFSHPQDGWVEVDPESHYRKVCGVIRELAAAAPGEVKALAMAGASGNTLLTDTVGAPLHPIINWMDKRAEQPLPTVLAALTSADVSRITGWPCVNAFPLAHLAWLREQRPALYARARHYGMDTDWLLYRLTGQWQLDHSTATTFHLQDQVSGTYHRPFLEMLNIPLDKLSPLVDSGVVVGPLTAQALKNTGLSATTQVVSGSFDHPAAARGTGTLTPGQLLLSCGTSWVGFTPALNRQTILDAGILCDPFLSARQGPWGAIFSVPYIGRTIDAYIDALIAPGASDKYRIFNESAAEAAPGAGGLEIDLRAPLVAVKASRSNISRAVMEGAARLLSEKARTLAPYGFSFKQGMLVGGPANSPVWPGIIASIMGIELSVGSRHAGALGAALLAGIGIGVYPDEHQAWAITHNCCRR